jgi:hypothetical protein
MDGRLWCPTRRVTASAEWRIRTGSRKVVPDPYPNLEKCMTTAASNDTTDITDIARDMWSYLTGKGATVEYSFDNMLVEVPKTTGPDSPRAVWKLDGTLRIKTTDRDNNGSAGA